MKKEDFSASFLTVIGCAIAVVFAIAYPCKAQTTHVISGSFGSPRFVWDPINSSVYVTGEQYQTNGNKYYSVMINQTTGDTAFFKSAVEQATGPLLGSGKLNNDFIFLSTRTISTNISSYTFDLTPQGTCGWGVVFNIPNFVPVSNGIFIYNGYVYEVGYDPADSSLVILRIDSNSGFVDTVASGNYFPLALQTEANGFLVLVVDTNHEVKIIRIDQLGTLVQSSSSVGFNPKAGNMIVSGDTIVACVWNDTSYTMTMLDNSNLGWLTVPQTNSGIIKAACYDAPSQSVWLTGTDSGQVLVEHVGFSGQTLSTNSYVVHAYDTGTSIISLPSGIFVAGVTGTKLFTMKLPQTTTGFAQAEHSQSEFSIYPNPATDHLVVEHGNGVARLTDMSGKKVLEKVISKHEDLDVGAFDRGTYILQIGSATKKIVLK